MINLLYCMNYCTSKYSSREGGCASLTLTPSPTPYPLQKPSAISSRRLLKQPRMPPAKFSIPRSAPTEFAPPATTSGRNLSKLHRPSLPRPRTGRGACVMPTAIPVIGWLRLLRTATPTACLSCYYCSTAAIILLLVRER
ncbi:unnamed protein product [Ectocarpus fasciculatus]